MSRPSFPRSVPLSGAALCSAGSLGLVRQLRSSYCGTPTSCFPSSLTLRASLGGSASRRRKQDLPSSSATLATHAPVNDPGGAYPSRPPGLRPYVLLSRCCLPSPPTRRPPQIPYFGARFRSLRARCLRFVSVVTFRSRKTRFRLAALPWPSGNSTRRVAYLVSVCSGYMTHLQDEAYLAHGGARHAQAAAAEHGAGVGNSLESRRSGRAVQLAGDGAAVRGFDYRRSRRSWP